MPTVEIPVVTEWTPEILERLPDDYRYEVHGGNLVVMGAAMRGWHADVQVRICTLLRDRGMHALIEQGAWLGPGETRTTDVAAFHDAPDLNRGIHQTSVFALIVEVESPGSEDADRVHKPRDYAAAGVPAYWRVEEAADGQAIVHQHTLEGGAYVETAVIRLVDLEADTGSSRRSVTEE